MDLNRVTNGIAIISKTCKCEVDYSIVADFVNAIVIKRKLSALDNHNYIFYGTISAE